MDVLSFIATIAKKLTETTADSSAKILWVPAKPTKTPTSELCLQASSKWRAANFRSKFEYCSEKLKRCNYKVKY